MLGGPSMSGARCTKRQQGRLFTWLSFGSALPVKVAQFSVGANSKAYIGTPERLALRWVLAGAIK